MNQKYRHLWHVNLDKAIADINKVCRPDFIVVDGTICLEAGGPVMGKPKVCNVIMASHDPVAVDTIVCKYMGINPQEIKYIKYSEEFGLGSSNNIEIVGDSLEINNFIPAIQNLNSIWHKRLRMNPFGDIFFKSFVFKLMSWVSTCYQIYWFYRNREKTISNQSFPDIYRKAVQWKKNIYLPL